MEILCLSKDNEDKLNVHSFIREVTHVFYKLKGTINKHTVLEFSIYYFFFIRYVFSLILRKYIEFAFPKNTNTQTIIQILLDRKTKLK